MDGPQKDEAEKSCWMLQSVETTGCSTGGADAGREHFPRTSQASTSAQHSEAHLSGPWHLMHVKSTREAQKRGLCQGRPMGCASKHGESVVGSVVLLALENLYGCLIGLGSDHRPGLSTSGSRCSGQLCRHTNCAFVGGRTFGLQMPQHSFISGFEASKAFA